MEKYRAVAIDDVNNHLLSQRHPVKISLRSGETQERAGISLWFLSREFTERMYW